MEAILADEILPMIVDHCQPKNRSIRKFRGIMSGKYVGLSRASRQKALELARKHGWHLPSNPIPELSPCSTSLTLPLIPGSHHALPAKAQVSSGGHGANIKMEEEIDERDPEFIRKETEAAVKRAYDKITKDQTSFTTSGQDQSCLTHELSLREDTI